jgi:hypothetical protein
MALEWKNRSKIIEAIHPRDWASHTKYGLTVLNEACFRVVN